MIRTERDRGIVALLDGRVSSKGYGKVFLRSLPEAYSLALRLQDAGVADEVICEYLHIERESLCTLLDVAHRKLDKAIDGRV